MVQQVGKQEINLPYPLKDLNQMIADTIEVLDNNKGLIITLGYSGWDYAKDFYLKPLRKNGVKNFQVAKLYQSDDPFPEHREITEPQKPIKPFGCHKAIIFDNSTRSFRSMAGAFKYVLPRCPEWGIHEVYTFIMVDENSGSNSCALPVYQYHGIPYKGPLHVFHEKSPNIFKELDKEATDEATNKKLTELVSTWASPIHSSTNLKDKIDKRLVDAKRMILNVRYRLPRSEQNLENS